jgi:hypothetical protein
MKGSKGIPKNRATNMLERAKRRRFRIR